MKQQMWVSAVVTAGVLFSALPTIGPAQAKSVVDSVSIATAKDPTRNLSKSERKKISFKVWVKSPTAKFLKKKESNNNCKATGGNGKYRGTWQMNAGFWKKYEGKKYASKPDKATCHEQDLVAYKGWLDRGWSPWPPAKDFRP
jgi:hypothetical protein